MRVITSQGTDVLLGAFTYENTLQPERFDGQGAPEEIVFPNLTNWAEHADESIRHLKQLKNLKQLFVWETKVSEAGCRRLQAALPKLKITRGVDLDEIATAAEKKAKEPAEPLVDLKWHPIDTNFILFCAMVQR